MIFKEHQMVLIAFLVVAFAFFGFGITPYMEKVAADKATADRAIYSSGFSDGLSKGVTAGTSLGADDYHRCLVYFSGNYFCNETTLRILDENYNEIMSGPVDAPIDFTPGGNIIILFGNESYFARAIR